MVQFAIKARLSLLPTNFTLHIWNRDNNPICPFCKSHTERVAELMNGCREFHNFYNRRHNRIADKIANDIKLNLPRYRIHSNMLAENVFPEISELITVLTHRKPDILVLEFPRCVLS